jgi:RNA polymerase sigma-70 factor (ECF subfamily)
MPKRDDPKDKAVPGPMAKLTAVNVDAPALGLSEPAFKSLYAQLLRPVFHYVRFRLGPADANDVTADIFTRAWRERGRFDPVRGNAEAWLWTMARNVVVDAARRRQVRPQAVAVEALPAATVGPAPDWVATWGDVRRGMARLAPVDQDIIALRFGAEMSNREIAARLALSETNVAQRLRRALLALRQVVDGEGWQ